MTHQEIFTGLQALVRLMDWEDMESSAPTFGHSNFRPHVQAAIIALLIADDHECCAPTIEVKLVDGLTRYNCDCLNAGLDGRPTDVPWSEESDDAIYCQRWVYLSEDVVAEMNKKDARIAELEAKLNETI